MSKKCVCGNEMFTVFMCRKCEHLLYVEEDENFPQKLGKIAAKSCPCCGEQDEGLWRLLGRAEGFEGTIFVEEQVIPQKSAIVHTFWKQNCTQWKFIGKQRTFLSSVGGITSQKPP